MKTTFGLALALVLIAAPGFAQKVTVDWDEDFDRGTVKTYTWVEPQQMPMNPMMQERLREAISKELAESGRKEVKAEENPDVFLTYHGSTKDEVVVTSDNFGYGYGRGWRGGGMGTSTSRSHTYTKGTLVIDVWDAKTKNMVFRGTITDTLSDKPEKNEKNLREGVEKLFKEFNKKYEKAEKKKAKEAEKK